ncbi:MAG: phage major capsid protein [Gammaproteobacteria bacterium]|nr:phage major capsid protein [Gammaproteobacteria bacterium]
MSNQVLDKITEFGDAVIALRKSNDARFDALQSRVELAESLQDRPRGAPGESRKDAHYKTFHVNGEKHFMLPHSVKASDIPDLAPAQRPEIALHRWLHAAVVGEGCKDLEALEFAREKKALTTGTSGILIPTEYQSEWIDAIRAKMVLNRAGMSTVIMREKSYTASAVTADPSASWHAEAGAITASNATFAARTLTAKTVVIRSQASMELAADSPDFGMQLQKVLTGAIAAEIDRVGLHGAGGNAPQGIYGASGISTTASVGIPTNYSHLTSALKTLMQSGLSLETAAKFAIMSPRTWLTYEGLVTGITNDKTPLQRPPSLQNMQFLITSNVSNTLVDGSSPQAGSAIFLGDFRDLAMGIRQQASVEIVKSDAYSGNLVLDFIAYARVDFALLRPASFVVLDAVRA